MDVSGYRLHGYSCNGVVHYHGERTVHGHLMSVAIRRDAGLRVAVMLTGDDVLITRRLEWETVDECDLATFLPIAIRQVEDEIAEELERTAAAIRGEVAR